MAKFRKKPVVVEAIQLTWENWNDICDFVPKKQFGGGFFVGGDNRTMGLRIVTLEGVMEAHEGDWIVKGVNGEVYPVKPDIFEKTYEPVEDVRATVKCQYHGCTEQATEHAVGYDENGDDHVYQVCLKHAAEMEPRVFGENLAAQQ